MEAKLCQSCGNALSHLQKYSGTNADGSLNEVILHLLLPATANFAQDSHYGRNDRTLCTVHRRIQQGFRNEFH